MSLLYNFKKIMVVPPAKVIITLNFPMFFEILTKMSCDFYSRVLLISCYQKHSEKLQRWSTSITKSPESELST